MTLRVSSTNRGATVAQICNCSVEIIARVSPEAKVGTPRCGVTARVPAGGKGYARSESCDLRTIKPWSKGFYKASCTPLYRRFSICYASSRRAHEIFQSLAE